MIAVSTGWTVQQIDGTPWPDVLDLLDYLGEHPPVHLMLEGYFGVGSDKAKPAGNTVSIESPEDMLRLM